MLKGKLFASCLLLLAAQFLAPASASAESALDDAWGLVSDPLGLRRSSKELSETVQRTMAQLFELERRTNADVTDRIKQVQGIVLEIDQAIERKFADIDAIVAKAILAAKSLEEQANKDAINLLYRAQCVAEKFTQDQLQRALAETIKNIKTADPGVEILGIKIIKVDFSEIVVVEPDQAYRSIKAKKLDDLRAQIERTKEKTDGYVMVSAYSNLAALASMYRCHYLDQALGTKFVSEYNEYERLVRPWLALGVTL